MINDRTMMTLAALSYKWRPLTSRKNIVCFPLQFNWSKREKKKKQNEIFLIGCDPEIELCEV